ncbi:hypothetical protein D3C77_556180 [compost metagenome]
MVHQALHRRRFNGGVIAGGGQHDAVAGFARPPFRAFEAFGKDGVGQGRQNQANGAGAARPQAAAHAVRPEAGAFGHVADMRQRIGMHDLGLVERARNRRRRNACLAGHFNNGKAGRRARGHILMTVNLLKTISSYKTNMTFVLHGFALCWCERNNIKPGRGEVGLSGKTRCFRCFSQLTRRAQWLGSVR